MATKSTPRGSRSPKSAIQSRRAHQNIKRASKDSGSPNPAAMQKRLGNRGTQAWVTEHGATQQVQMKNQLDEMNERDDTEKEETLQGKFESSQRQIPENAVKLQGKLVSNEIPTQLQGNVDEAENRTGMPDPLKEGLEQLSGMDLSAVQVHHNSSKPAQLNASAYTQAQDIHVGPGQEKHLPHEGWHVVQQMQGRVQPTMQTKDVSINDDEALEREADVMGEKALQMKRAEQSTMGIPHQGSIPLQRVLQLDVLEDYNVWPITGSKAGRVWLGAVPNLVYEKANYSNSIGWWQSLALSPTLTANAYEYISRMSPSRQEIISWTGKPGSKTTNITAKRLKKAPPIDQESSYRHVFGSTVGAYADIEAYTDFDVRPLVVSVKDVSTDTISDYSNMIPIQSTGGTEVEFTASTSNSLQQGYSVTKSRGKSKYLASEITSSIGVDLGFIAAKIESSIAAKQTIENTVKLNAEFAKEITTGKDIKIKIPSTTMPINKVVIPKYRIVTLTLETRKSTAMGVDKGSTEISYIHYIRPTGVFDLLDSTGGTDVEPISSSTPEAAEAYKAQKEGEESAFEPIDKNSVIHSVKLIARHEAVKNYADQKHMTLDGPTELATSDSHAVKVTNGLRYTKGSSVSKEINASIKSQIGLGDAVTKATGISASVGGKVSSGQSIKNSVERSINSSQSSSFTVSDKHTVKVPPDKRSTLYLTPLVKMTSYEVTLINGKTLYVHYYVHQPVRHSHVYTTPKGIKHPSKWRDSTSASTGPEKLDPSEAQKKNAKTVKKLRAFRDSESDPKKKKEYADQIEAQLKSVRNDHEAMVRKVHPSLKAIDADDNLYKITIDNREYFGTLEVLADLSAPSPATLAAGERLFSKDATDTDGTRIEVAGGLGGTGAQGRVNPFPGDIDLSEQVKVTASTPTAASQALARTVQQTVREAIKPTTVGQPPMQFLRLTCGVNPPDSKKKSGGVLGWTYSQVMAGSQTYKKKDGSNGTITLAEAFANPHSKRVVNTFWRGPIDRSGSFGEITKVMAYEAINKDTGKTMFATPKIGQAFQEVSFEKPLAHDTERIKLMDALAPQVADYAKQGNWVKAVKRALTVARMGGDFEAVNDFGPLLRSSHSELKTVTEHTEKFNEEVINNKIVEPDAHPDAKEVVSRDAAFLQANQLASQINRHAPAIAIAMKQAIEAGGDDLRRNKTVYRLTKNKVVKPLEEKIKGNTEFNKQARNVLMYHSYLKPEDLK